LESVERKGREALVVSSTLTALVWLPLPLKIALTVATIAPLGFAMGMQFPTALRRLEEWHAPPVRWAWSLNARRACWSRWAR